MKHLFFVSVATGIFSGTSLTVKAQPSVNIERVNASVPVKKSQKFIDGIEIRSGAIASENTVMANTAVLKNTTPKTAAVKSDVSSIESCSSLQFKYALLLDMDVENITNKVLFDEIEKWLDTRYRYGGTTSRGIDCSAYTGTLLTDVYGQNVPRTSRAQYEGSEKIEKEDLQEGDLVFFNTRRRGKGVSHVGLYLGNGYFTHAGSSTGVTISNLSETYWNSKYIGGGRILSVASAQ
ncbi:MAG TPA: NlpC/P60 family protein [Ferruginibacter sp.]|nr:NlpC/P60 family protein [Ferruginibacter sp.]